MTTKVNGFLKQGKWFEKDTCIMLVESDATPFAMPIGPLSGTTGSAEKVFNVLSTRGTVIGYNRIDDASASFMFGHASGHFSDGDTLGNGVGTDVLDELKADLDATGTGVYTLTVFDGFAGAIVTGEAFKYGDEQSPDPTPADSTPITEG